MKDEQIKEFMHIMNRLARHSNDKRAFGIIPRSEFFIMSVIDDYCKNHENENGITVSSLARAIEMGNASVSKQLSIIESKGYIKRLADDVDRRLVYIKLSEKGADLIKCAKIQADEKMRNLLKLLGEQDIKELIRIFNKLLEAMKHQNQDRDEGNK